MSSYQITSQPDKADAIKAATDKEQAERVATVQDRVQVRTGGSHSVTFRGSEAKIEHRTVQKLVRNSSDVSPGFVRLSNGSITPLDAALAGGLSHMIVEYGDSSRRGVSTTDILGQPQTLQTNGANEPTDDAPDKKDTASDSKGDDLDLSSDDKATLDQAAAILNKANETLGAPAVGELVSDVILSGEMPTEPPGGATQAEMDTVVAGLTAQANAVLRSSGASVDTLNELLTEAELREARRATWLNDDKTLKELGGVALRRLRKLPEDDPAAFKEMTVGFDPSIKLHKKNGSTWISGPGLDMPWAHAVQKGYIKF